MNIVVATASSPSFAAMSVSGVENRSTSKIGVDFQSRKLAPVFDPCVREFKNREVAQPLKTMYM